MYSSSQISLLPPHFVSSPTGETLPHLNEAIPRDFISNMIYCLQFLEGYKHLQDHFHLSPETDADSWRLLVTPRDLATLKERLSIQADQQLLGKLEDFSAL